MNNSNNAIEIDVTEVLDDKSRIYIDNELVSFLQDFKIRNNKIKMYEACTINGINKIIDKYNKIVQVKLTYFNEEIVLKGQLDDYKITLDDSIYTIEYTISLIK